MTKPWIYSLLLGASLLTTGCKKDVTVIDETQDPGSSDKQGGDEDASVAHIDRRIADLCSLPNTEFGFNSAKLTPKDVKVLDALATCFTTGPAAGLNLRLVGHADPRGTDEYNLALGQRRADSVGGHLTDRGVGTERIESSSRGKLDATGTDETTWVGDRRVDVLLADEG